MVLAAPNGLPPVIVDSQGYGTENNWLACVIAKRMAGLAWLALHPGQPLPDLKVRAQVDADKATVHVEITGFAAAPVVADLKPQFAWDPAGYAPLARQLLGNATPPPAPANPLPDELTDLLELTGPNLARDDVAVSGLLASYPSWAAAHEDAALLAVGLALRDRAGIWSDTRQLLCRATAHLAMAAAFRGDAPATWPGQIADAGIRTLAGREVDALGKIDLLSAQPDAPAPAPAWLTAFRLRAKDDWRLATPDANSALLVKIAWSQVLNDNLSALNTQQRLDKIGVPDNVPDFGHAALDNVLGASVQTYNTYCESTLSLDLAEMKDVLTIEQNAPDVATRPGVLLSQPLQEKLLTGQPATLWVLGPDMFKEMARQHVLMDVFRTRFWLKDELGEPDAAQQFVAETGNQLAGMRFLQASGFFTDDPNYRLGKNPVVRAEKTVWEPWEFPTGGLIGIDEKDEPDYGTLMSFYRDGLPFGTVFNLWYRRRR